ncbi:MULTISPECIES: hypothetical protein [unclassified Mycoplasma]|uniref:hypothetical protein n=1 Tax=unclassified Mycoplasma TaxID=2683645 RepID=UPI00216B6656|nr:MULTISPECIES: hypothetical protein [unclassified Mycoplasma]MCS4536902.1 hypothetical protein [Mycoplasma sp. CSL7475-4]MCT4469432.1 hypothetical protein [Mycoplasma sp. HS2188]
MDKLDVSKIFIDILETTPGVFSIKCPYDEQSHIHDDCVIVNSRDNVWDFTASITILKNSNLKNIVTSINSLLRFALRKKNQKLGKLNILIGGLNND